MGTIITFYSYKGGTGRSMALANAAWALASNQKKVLVVDWDLEAPGLHRYFRPFLVDKDLTGPVSRGLIEFVRNYETLAATPPMEGKRAENWHDPHAAIWEWGTTLRWPQGKEVTFGTRGVIRFVPAGRQGPEYAQHVNTFDWPALYRNHGGESFFESVREQVKREFDYVLIDSRTGVSDTSGICTIQMPDILVVCYTYNLQSIDGAADIARRVRDQKPQTAIFPVAMRVEQNETDLIAPMRKRARALFGQFVPDNQDRYFDDMEIPYRTKYAFWEYLAAFEEFPNRKDSLNRDFREVIAVATGGRVSQIPVEERLRSEVFEEFKPTPGDAAPGQKESRRPPIRWGALIWAAFALAAFALMALMLIREPSPGRRKAEEIMAYLSSTIPPGSLTLSAGTPQVITQVGALIEMADLPEPKGARQMLTELWKSGIPTFADRGDASGLDRAGTRVVTCGDMLRIWTISGKPLIAETPLSSASTGGTATIRPMQCGFLTSANRAVVIFPGGKIPVAEVYEWPNDGSRMQAKRVWASGARSTGGPVVQQAALSADGGQIALAGWSPKEWSFEVWGVNSPTPKQLASGSIPTKSSSALSIGQLYATRGGFVLPDLSASDITLFPIGGALSPRTVSVPAPVHTFALDPSGFRLIVWNGQDVESVDIESDKVTDKTPLALSQNSSITFSPSGKFAAFATDKGFDIRQSSDFQKLSWAVNSAPYGAPQINDSGNVALESTSVVFSAPASSYQMVFRQNPGKLPDANAPWKEAIRELRAYTSLCMPPEDRQRILLETQDESWTRYADCEVSQGRVRPSPPRLSPLAK